MKAIAILAIALGFSINRQPRMRPTLNTIHYLKTHGSPALAKRLEAIRESRSTRYAASSLPSQRQRRKADRQKHPHGF